MGGAGGEAGGWPVGLLRTRQVHGQDAGTIVFVVVWFGYVHNANKQRLSRRGISSENQVVTFLAD